MPENEKLLRDYASGKIDHKTFVERTTLPSSSASEELRELSKELERAIEAQNGTEGKSKQT
jgi:hypothetical protein